VTQRLEFDRSLLEREYSAGPFQVTREAILGFCRAIGETSPLYTDEEAARRAGYRSIVAPPTFCTFFVRRVVQPDIRLKFGRIRFHAGQVVEPMAPIVAGDTLMATSRLRDVYAKTGRSGTMVFIVWQTIFTNQEGRKVAAVEESFAVRE
jgi:acyl dehydratase